jgi:hypothetical protein
MDFSLINTSVAWWSPKWQTIYNQYAVYDAWYSGDVSRLANLYAASVYNPFALETLFWARMAGQERATCYHLPIANDIAATSAALLFSEAPSITIPGAADVTDAGNPVNTAAKKAQDRLNAILAAQQHERKWVEAAESCAAMSGIFLKVNWDKSLADTPILSVAQPDAAFPEFKQGYLTACTFWAVAEETGREIIRTVERYDPGMITTEKYSGDSDSIGRRIEQKKFLVGDTKELLCRYVPNLRPNPLHRNGVGMHLGRSDFHNAEPLFDSVDEIWTDWMRDIQLAKGRIAGNEDMFKLDEKTGKRVFDIDQQAYMPLRVIGNTSLRDQLVLHQFAIRADEHEKTLLNALRLIYSTRGYNPQTFGIDINGQPESGVALSIRERKSFQTSGRKECYWKEVIADVCYLLQLVDRLQFGSQIEPMRPAVEISEGVELNFTEMSQALNQINAAKSMSIETKVEMLHPQWTAERKRREVDAIRQEDMFVGPDPTLQIGLP